MDEADLATALNLLNTSILVTFGDDTFLENLSVARDTSGDYHELCSQLRQPFAGLNPRPLNTSLWDPASPLEDCDSLYYRSGMLARSLYD